MCSGKVYYDLVKHRETKKIDDVAIIRVEELSPFPYRALADELDKYRNADSYRWAQEEPQNAGAWDYVAPRFSRLSAPVRHQRPSLVLHF
jgi:2-oxoglutarate dehydrogenase E1 component